MDSPWVGRLKIWGSTCRSACLGGFTNSLMEVVPSSGNHGMAVPFRGSAQLQGASLDALSSFVDQNGMVVPPVQLCWPVIEPGVHTAPRTNGPPPPPSTPSNKLLAGQIRITAPPLPLPHSVNRGQATAHVRSWSLESTA